MAIYKNAYRNETGDMVSAIPKVWVAIFYKTQE